MKQLFGEILTTFFIFICIVIMSIIKQKKLANNNDNIYNYKENLEIFANLCGVEGKNFNEILQNLEKENKVKVINKDMNLEEFIEVLGKDNFKQIPKNSEKINQKNISKTVKNLNKNLALGLYPLEGGKYLAFLREQNELLDLIDAATNLDESIILCD